MFIDLIERVNHDIFHQNEKSVALGYYRSFTDQLWFLCLIIVGVLEG